jgi:hypothetical protein
MARVRRVVLFLVCLAGTALIAPAMASAQAPLIVSVTSRDTDYSWTGDPATVTGRATYTDGNAAALQPLTVESRPYPYTGAFTPVATIPTDANGQFTYEQRPTKNVQVRIRGDSGQASPILTFRVFALSQEGGLKSLKHGRYRARETSLVPTGFKIAKAYLYFCKPKAKRCSFAKTGKAKISGQRLTASALFTPPKKYAAKKYTVFFRYVPKAGWGDSNPSERKKPKQTLPASSS